MDPLWESERARWNSQEILSLFGIKIHPASEGSFHSADCETRRALSLRCCLSLLSLTFLGEEERREGACCSSDTCFLSYFLSLLLLGIALLAKVSSVAAPCPSSRSLSLSPSACREENKQNQELSLKVSSLFSLLFPHRPCVLVSVEIRNVYKMFNYSLALLTMLMGRVPPIHLRLCCLPFSISGWIRFRNVITKS